MHTLGIAIFIVPVLGGLIVGLTARYGSEKIRGHGIPEAIEAILFDKSRMSPKVALLKPLSSDIVIGSGGPFGAEAPHDWQCTGLANHAVFPLIGGRTQDAAGFRCSRRA